MVWNSRKQRREVLAGSTYRTRCLSLSNTTASASANSDLIFSNPDGSPLKPDSVSASVSLLCRRLRLPKGASLHMLRHSNASILLANGVDLATVSARLGHSSVRVTADVYSHALRGRDREAAGRWDELMGRNAGADSTTIN